jgi:hypothetical protein
MGKFKDFRFDLPIMFCLLAIIAVTVYLVKAVKLKFDEAARSILHVDAVCYTMPNRPDWPPIRSIHYSVSFPGLPNKPSDFYTDDCTGVEPGFLNHVNATGSSTLHVAMEPGLVTQALSTHPPITERMQSNFELLKKHLAEQLDVNKFDWQPGPPERHVFRYTIKLPGDFPTALP